MVFSSVPAPSIWHPHPQQPQSVGEDGNHTQLVSPGLVLHEPEGGGGGGSNIPADGSKLHQAAALKCPRCESRNTKFCYFNNYNLSQPRHFCKSCRRYWTRGGALRNVPVGGGCRRNNKSTASKGHGPPKLAFLPSSSLHHHHHHHHLNNIDHGHDLISIGGNPNSHYSTFQHQFPFWEPPTPTAPLTVLESAGVNIQADDGSAGTFKMEENHDQGLNLSKRFNLGISSATLIDNNIDLHYFWGITGQQCYL